MAENPDGVNNPLRRKILKAVPEIAVATGITAILGNEINHEIGLAETGIFETKEAVWIPLYERHDQHEQVISPKNIPPNIQAISLEGTKSESIYNNGVESKLSTLQTRTDSMFLGIVQGYDTSPPTNTFFIPPETLDYLKKHKIPVAVGDLRYQEAAEFNSPDPVNAAQKTRYEIGEKLLEAGLVTGVIGEWLKSAKTDRRGFLRLLGGGLFGAGAVTAFPPLLRRQIHEKLMESIKNKDPFLRLWARIHTIDSNLMPEFLNDMFRELNQAGKLFTLAANLKSPDGKKPVIAYNWHYGHRGIEDWLRVGPDFVRSCILTYPDSTLKTIIKSNNNDPRSLYAVRLAQVPESLKLISANVAKGEMMSTFDPDEKVDDRILEDHLLALQLHDRGII
jgi:hypothetical protein